MIVDHKRDIRNYKRRAVLRTQMFRFRNKISAVIKDHLAKLQSISGKKKYPHFEKRSELR